MLYTTGRLAREAGACESRYKKMAKYLGGVRKYGLNTPVALDKILEVCGFDDALWVLRCTTENSDRFNRLLACRFAEEVLPIYEKEYPKDKRPRRAIEVTRLYANGRATDKELAAAWAAAWAAARDDAWAAEIHWQKQHLVKLMEELFNQ